MKITWQEVRENSIQLAEIVTVIAVVAMILVTRGCPEYVESKRSPDTSDPYGGIGKGLRDKGAHKKGTGFNE